MTETQQQRTWPEEVTGGRSQPGLPGTPVPRAPDGVSARRPRGPPAHNSESSGPRSQELAPLSRALYSRSGQDKTVTRELHARIAHVRTHTAYQTRTCGCSFLADKWRTRFESPPQTPDEPTPQLHSPHWTSCAGTEHGLGRGGGGFPTGATLPPGHPRHLLPCSMPQTFTSDPQAHPLVFPSAPHA